jgi:hypothetical protein
MRAYVPADLRRDTFDEFYSICQNEIEIYERARAKQEARLRQPEGGE